ncbi:MAG TPA: hypothetical protein VGE79_11905, partial [Niastella sp.]
MENRYTSYAFASILALLITAGLANAQNTITVSGAGTSAVNGTYTYAGTSSGRPYYTYGGYTLIYAYDTYYVDDNSWLIYQNVSTPL